MFEYLRPHDGPVIDGLEEHEIILAKDQREYIPLRVLRGKKDDCRVVSRWSPTPEQREAIANGADIFLTLLTFDNPPMPVNLAVSDNPNPDFFRESLGLPGSEWFKQAQEAHELYLKEKRAMEQAIRGELGTA